MVNRKQEAKGGEWTKVLTDARGCARQRCGRAQAVHGPRRVYWHQLPTLGRVIQTEQVYVCPKCTRAVRWENHYILVGEDTNRHDGTPRRDARTRTNERVHAHLIGQSDNDRFTDVQYPAVWIEDTGDLLPVHEGTIQDGTYIDPEGSAELMAEFAQQYLSAYRAAMPKGGLPDTIVEVMPALHLLLIAAELALKADLIRSGRPARGHRLKDLYSSLEDSHREVVDDLFGQSDPIVRLQAAAVATPSVLDIVTVYDESYGRKSGVYLDTRYYAEPGLGGIKSSTPYPVFFPHVVEATLAAFWLFDGAARLKRLGADLEDASFAYRRKWRLVPASLGLVVVRVSQRVVKDGSGQDSVAFRSWRRAHLPGYETSRGYGGSTLLFYRAEGAAPPDGEQRLDGIECRISRRESLEIHSRDLHHLADLLDRNDTLSRLRALTVQDDG